MSHMKLKYGNQRSAKKLEINHRLKSYEAKES